MTYTILTEDETIDRALAGASLARFGDGELRLALGGTAVSQKFDPSLQAELRSILSEEGPELCCIPHTRKTKPNWATYQHPRYIGMYLRKEYGSAFISRPDSAPHIDRADYWNKVERLWRGRDVIFVQGDRRSLREEQMTSAKSLVVVPCDGKDAYHQVKFIEATVVHHRALHSKGAIVLMCLGATATVLARRLAKHGIQAVDLGHVGMFMRHAGSYNLDNRNLITPEYREQNRLLHEGLAGYGGSGHREAARVNEFVRQYSAESVLDYGCGEGTLKKKLMEMRCQASVKEYDPAIPRKEFPPRPADLVVCTDVLEHVEPECLDNVLQHLHALSIRGCYLVIATRLANKTLPDGRNTHLIVEQPPWWFDRVLSAGFELVWSDQPREPEGDVKVVRMFLRPERGR